MASPPKPEASPPKPPHTSPARPSKWASLLARIYKVFPLICPSCQMPLTFIPFLTDPEPITRILAHIGEPSSPPLIHPPWAPPQAAFHMGPGQGKCETVSGTAGGGTSLKRIRYEVTFRPFATGHTIPLDILSAVVE